MTRTPLDPSLLDHADPARDAVLLDGIVQSLRPSARALAARVFAREVIDAIDGPTTSALASLLKDRSSVDFTAVHDGRARALLDSLSAEESAAIDEHAEDIASTLARAWVDLWSRAASEADGALRVDRAVPDERSLDQSWAECAAQLGLERAEADALVLAFCQRIRSEGATVSLPLGLALDGRASDVWLHREGAIGALPEEVVRSGEQLRGPAISLDDARKRRGG